MYLCLLQLNQILAYSSHFNKDVLYFVSDREGGKGKMDIWYSIIDKNGSYTHPQNLVTINTAEDDITPNFHSSSNTFYFSSNGYLSMGGFDIYSSHIEILNLKRLFTRDIR